MRSVQIADQARRIAPRRINRGVDLERVHHLHDRLTQGGAYPLAALAAGARFGQLGGLRRVAQSLFDRGMKLPTAKDLVDGFYRRVGPARGKVAFEIGLESVAPALLSPLDGVERIDPRLDDHRTLRPQIRHGALEHPLHFGVERGTLVGLP